MESKKNQDVLGLTPVLMNENDLIITCVSVWIFTLIVMMMAAGHGHVGHTGWDEDEKEKHFFPKVVPDLQTSEQKWE